MTKPVLLANAFAATCLFASYGATAGCSALYGQCGGIGWTGATCCATGSSCQYVNGNYYQCLTYVGNSACAATYGQCGGIGWTGATCCQSDWSCDYSNDYYYQCLPPTDTSSPTSSSKTSTTTTSTSRTSTASTACATNWGQCGGIGWTGPTCCNNDWPCVYGNDYYYQCISPSSASALSASKTTSSTTTTKSTTSSTTTTTKLTASSTTSTKSTTSNTSSATSTSSRTTTKSTTSSTTTSSSTTPTTSKVSTSSTTSTLKSSSSSSTTTASASASSTGDRLQYGGVNIAGFEFGSYDTCGIHTAQPDADPTDFVAQIKHFVDDDKLNAFRLPVSWQYLINQFDGSSLGTNKLDSNNFATYDDLVQGCLDAGASLCIIDIHNYARFNGYIIGQDGPTAAQFASLWSQIATNYASESRVAFGLMNEPHDESCNSANGGVMDIDTWAATLQTVVNAIRSAGATSQLIIMPGKGWTHSITYLDASGDGSGPALMGITDPAGGTSKLVFEVHEYLDSNNAGSSSDCVTSSIDSSYGRGGLQNLANYLRSNGRFAMITESGGLNNANCATYLCKELNFLANNTDVFLGYTTWAAGGFDSSYELTETPTLSGSTWTDTSLVQACVAKCFTGTC